MVIPGPPTSPPIQTPPSARLFTCPYSTDATNNPQQTNPRPWTQSLVSLLLAPVLHPVVTVFGSLLKSCLSPCRARIQTPFSICSTPPHHQPCPYSLPTYLPILGTRGRLVTQPPVHVKLPRVHYSVLLSWNSNSHLVLMFTSLPSPPGRLYELSFSSSASLDFLPRKVCSHFDITPSSRQRADHLSNWNLTHDLVFDSSLPLRVLPHSLTHSLFSFFLFLQSDHFLFLVTMVNNVRLYPHKLSALQPPAFPVSVVSHPPPHLLGQGYDLSPLVSPARFILIFILSISLVGLRPSLCKP